MGGIIRKLNHASAGNRQLPSDRLVTSKAPILVRGHRLVRWNIRLHDHKVTTNRFSEFQFLIAEEQLACNWREVQIPYPFAAARTDAVVKPAALVVCDPFDIGRPLVSRSRNVRIVAKDLFRPRAVDYPLAVAESDALASRFGTTSHAGRHDLVTVAHFSDDHRPIRRTCSIVNSDRADAKNPHTCGDASTRVIS